MAVKSQQLQALHTLPIYQMPTELVLQILRELELNDYSAIISATLPLLRRCNIVQDMSTPRLRALLMETRRGFFGPLSRIADRQSRDYIPPAFRQSFLHHLAPTSASFPRLTPDLPRRLRGGFDMLPPEIRILILHQLCPEDKINVVLACYRFSDEDIERMTHERI